MLLIICVCVFQILGFDILLMKNLKPVLLEVNSNPSMRIEHEQEVRANADISIIASLWLINFTVISTRLS